MGQSEKTESAYRTVELEGLGSVLIPSHMSEANVMNEVLTAESAATPRGKPLKIPE
ncbi:hypothetical protein Z946_1773 [Sulfitobacter noctilucicola]|uniref:Uncharacterized protein n=1 Tax=Sulfitobacter noctilucicola TaxID=1342301 RepID=A0A7W6M511_9RHOB|nr:hypothetical protein Z946_1773 [Sulfitobacter noctilucicola]MBB4172560.1 hypothetical protein [Sulfitobacter noctilucicola]